MLKRLFTAFLAAVTVMSMTLGISAVETKAPDGQKNLFEVWGDFETEEYWEDIPHKIRFNGSSAKATIADIGADGSGHSLKTDTTASNSPVFWMFAGQAPGETYDISMKIKTDTPEVSTFSLISVYDETDYIEAKTIEFNSRMGWVDFKVTVTAPTEVKGRKVDRGTKFQISTNDKNGAVLYIDNIVMTPYGNVERADHSLVNSGIVSFEEGDGVEVTPPAESVDVAFADIDSHWAKETIETLAKYSYVNGISETEFAPDSTLTRAQFVKMVTDLYDEEVKYEGTFSDVSSEQWFAPSFAKAEKLGLIDDEMIKGDAVSPDSAITREEAAYIASVVAKDRGAKAKSVKNFSDESAISNWAKEKVSDAAALGMINGYTDGTFKPKANLTRAEASAMLMRLIETSERINIYVDAEVGNDKNDGKINSPLASIEAARDMAKLYAPKMRNDIYIKIRGEQYIEETFRLDESNSGQNGYKIIYTSWGDKQANITMAKKFRGFELHDKDKNIWRVNVGKGTYSRTAYFNDVPGIRARTVGYLKNVKYVYQSHFLCDNMELLSLAYPNEVESIHHMLWYMVTYQVKKISLEDGRVRIDMHDAFYHSSNRIDYYDRANSTNRQTPSYLENAYEFLDRTGEWYLNKHTGYLYYIPRQGEDMENMEVKLPIGEEMMHIAGSNLANPICHISFDNLMIEGTTWLKVEREGAAEFLQNNKFTDSRRNTAEGFNDIASLYFYACRYIDVTNCDFRHLGSAGHAIEFYEGAKHINFIGNEFYQLGGGALEFDYPRHLIPHHRPAASLCEYINVKNNYFHDIAMDFSGCSALAFGHPRHVRVSYNEIANTYYSGIHTGWGWADLEQGSTPMYDFEVSYNYIHDVMVERVNDGGHFYNVGPASDELDRTPDAPNNGANKNRIIYNNFVNGWNCSPVYPDNGSSSWYVANNVCDVGHVDEIEYNFDEGQIPRSQYYWMHLHINTIKWITTENNYSQSDYAYAMNQMNQQESDIEPTKFIKNGEVWPDDAYKIIDGAGIEEEYRDKFDLDGPKIFATSDRWMSVPLNTPHDSELMVLGDHNKKYDLSDYQIYWWIDDPEAVTIDKNGMMTAHKKGLFEAEAFIFLNGIWQSKHFLLECGDEVESVSTGYSSVNLAAGQSADIKISATRTFGQVVDVTQDAEINIKSEDPSVVTIEKSEDGTKYIVTAQGAGSTNISGTVTYEGKTLELSVPAKIITYTSEDGNKLPFTPVDLRSGWETRGMQTEDGGLKVAGYGYQSTKEYEGLMAFDLKIEPGHGWPAIAFCDDNPGGNYTRSSVYMIGFREKSVEFQRFNYGARTMIFGNNNNPIGALGVPNNGDYEYGKRFSVVMGAIKTPQGTRVVLNINGRNIFDYLDTDKNALVQSGYLEIYNPDTNNGGMTFYPYSGITE